MRANMPSPEMAVTCGTPSASTVAFTSIWKNGAMAAYGSLAAAVLLPGVGTATPSFASALTHATALPVGTLTV